ncbi:MAG: serine hydrolase [Candidatus Eremiobacteraeota bacterium]|nr:serine hydrolase [Candidatus Eremiobacteraeota bacterium]
MTSDDLASFAEQTGLGAAQVHLANLTSHERWDRDDGRWLYPASMIKLPLAVAAGAAIDAGRLGWESAVTVEASNSTPNDASSPMVPGYRTTVEELVTLMLQRSDNVATNVLYDVLERGRATDDVHSLGLRQTFFRRKLSGAEPLIDDPAATGRNSFPAAEALALLIALAEDRFPQSAALRRILATSWWDTKLSRGLAPDDRFAHKTGDTDEVSHDGGLLALADGSRWAIVVYTELPSSEENDQRFGAFMRALRPFLTSAAR